MGMIVASWIMSAIISVPPLFGLQDPTNDSTDSIQSFNRSRGDILRLESTSGYIVPDEDLSHFEQRDFGALEGVELSYSDESYGMSSDDVSLMYADAVVNETISSELDQTETNCIITQNLGYTDFLLVLPRILSQTR